MKVIDLNRMRLSTIITVFRFWTMKMPVMILMLFNITFLSGQTKDEKEYYTLVNSLIIQTRKIPEKITIIDSVKSPDYHLDQDYILSFQLQQDKELKELLNSDTTWVNLLKKTYDEQEIKVNIEYFDPLLINFASNIEIQKYWTKDQHFDWRKFKRKYRSTGIMKFSTLKTINNKGLIYYEIRRDALNGAGFMVFFDNNNGYWIQRLSVKIWEQ